MNEPREDAQAVARRRIAVLLGSGSHCRHMLDALLPLLEQDRSAELLGVFVEDAELEAAADLPFVKELCRLTSSVREFRPSDARRELARRLREARDHLAAVAERAGVTHSLQSVRGPALMLLQQTVRSSDITLFEPIRLAVMSQWQTQRSPALRAPRVAVVIPGAQAAGILRLAIELAQHGTQALAVLLTPAAGEDPAGIERLLADNLPAGKARVELLADDSMPSIIAAARSIPAGCLVLPATPALLEGENLRLLREQLNCPVVVVRSG